MAIGQRSMTGRDLESTKSGSLPRHVLPDRHSSPMDHRLLLPPHALPPAHFAPSQDQIEITGYQLYAVEKWIVERKNIPILVVYTGDPAHRVSLTALTPDPPTAWDAAITLLRADGAKPKKTPHGVLMVTSLAHFRSDYTIVHIPDGNFLPVRDQLYANINLLRMGCSGRTALTLEDPSDTTKDRFISTYHLPETTTTVSHSLTSLDHLPLTQAQSPSASPRPKPNSPQIGLGRPSITAIARSERQPNHSTSSLPTRKEKEKPFHGKTKERATFVATVLELVKLVQAGLALFGLYGCNDSPNSVPANLVLDGLLCDDTVEGIRRWIATIGGPCVGLEPSERLADPMFVAALLSLVLSIRNKLAHLACSSLPRDPFLNPHAFSIALGSYVQTTAPTPAVTPSPPSSHATSPPFFMPHTAFGTHHLAIAHLAGIPTPPSYTPSPFIPAAPPPANLLSAAAASAAALASGTRTPTHEQQRSGVVLTRELVESIGAAHDAKVKSESRKVRKAIKNRLAPDGYRERTSGAGGERRKTLSISLSGAESAGGAGERSPVGSGGPASGIGSSGGQILSGIGSLASGLGGLVVGGPGGGGAGVGGDASCVLAPTVDLPGFVSFALGSGSGAGAGGNTGASAGGSAARREKKQRKSVERERRRESVDTGIGIGYAYAHARERERERDREGRDAVGAVGASVKALWGGRVADVVRMREGSFDDLSPHSSHPHIHGSLGHRERWKRSGGVPLAVASDGDGDESYREGGRHGKNLKYDGRSTEDESDTIGGGGGGHAGGSSVQSFGGAWGGRVKGKLGSWAGLGRRKHQSVDLSATSSVGSSLKLPLHPLNPLTSSSSKDAPPPLPKLSIGPNTTTNADISRSPSVNTNPYAALGVGGSRSRRPPATRQSTGTGAVAAGAGVGSRPQSPMVFSAEADRELEDDDLLSSGQVSPLSDYRPNPFNFNLGSRTRLGVGGAHPGAPSGSAGGGGGGGSSTHLDERTLARLLAQKRPGGTQRFVQGTRVSSWADPVSAREGELDGDEEGDGASGTGLRNRPQSRSRERYADEEGEDESDISELRVGGGGMGAGVKRKEKARFHSLLSVVDGEGVLAEELMESSADDSDDEAEEEVKDDQHLRRQRGMGFDMKRRRSFHDLGTFHGIEVLSPERMRIDVDICGQVLTLLRREDHVRNVIKCVQLVAHALEQSNASMREHYESHLSALVDIDLRSRVLAEIDIENATSDRISQATNMLRYEAEQFNVRDLWQAASPSRQKVFALREKVFGTGGRRLPTGVHGAHDTFNRLQWTLDGQKRLVDHLGRTESEAEEERRIDPHRLFIGGPPETEDEEDVVEHPGMKPMWLLRFFTSWGARWSAAASTPASTSAPAMSKERKVGSTSPSPPGEPDASSPVSDDEKQASVKNGAGGSVSN
ncbi:unnamed protein product [Cyclocybe aegerita]|uniref:STB6-like N-terminal domain-containing protein n=1 Tax=Cyclocybe aegerita TaxID=1973307 RepID=A0A8S0WDN4_CYCAE|nr:unnamed protein product [Cyclocybe aegerita]